MSHDYFTLFLSVAVAGLGLCLIGALNLVLSRARLRVRMPATVAILAATLAAAVALDQPGVASDTACYLALGLFPCLLLSSRTVVRRASAVVASLQLPAVRFGLVTTAGIALIVASVVAYERADRKATETTTAELELIVSGTPTTQSNSNSAATDRGTRIVLREPIILRDEIHLTASQDDVLRRSTIGDQVIRREPASDHANCHGWVFTGGRFLLHHDDVELILKENGYEEVDEPHVGDVVIYRVAGEIAHTALVRYVTEGQPVIVEGKWGAFGVFLHPADKSIYGPEYTFHRSSRSGHIIAGVAPPAPARNQPMPTATE